MDIRLQMMFIFRLIIKFKWVGVTNGKEGEPGKDVSRCLDS